MKNKNLQLMVRTALLLAVTVLFQNLRLLIGESLATVIIIGSLVNLSLIVSAGIVGWKGSIVVALLSPVVAFIEGHIKIPVLMLYVAAGNLSLVLAFELIERHSNKNVFIWAGLGAGAVIKAAVLYCLIIMIFVGSNAALMASVVFVNFSWPVQLSTALIGGIIAVPVLKGLRKALGAKENIGKSVEIRE